MARDKSLNMRISEDELELIDMNAEAAGMNRTDFIIAAATQPSAGAAAKMRDGLLRLNRELRELADVADQYLVESERSP